MHWGAEMTPKTVQKLPGYGRYGRYTGSPAAAKIFGLVHRGENVDIFFDFLCKIFLLRQCTLLIELITMVQFTTRVSLSLADIKRTKLDGFFTN